MTGSARILAFDTVAEASQALADAVAAGLRSAIARRGAATLAVPGGTTPRLFLTALGNIDLPWTQVTLLPTDERVVSPDDARSNERMIRHAFAPLRQGLCRFVSFHGPGDAQTLAGALAAEVYRLAPLDVVVSGMGTDAHIASLFPDDPRACFGLPAASVIAAAPEGQEARLSLSAHRLAEARMVAILMAGDEKRRVLEHAVSGPATTHTPVTILTHGAGDRLVVYWARA